MKKKVTVENEAITIEETWNYVTFKTDSGNFTFKRGIENPIYQQAIDKFGVPSQVDMLIEEMAELTQALLKWRRGKDDMDNVHEEIVDVEIMLAQIKTGLSEEKLNKYRTEKLERLSNLLK